MVNQRPADPGEVRLVAADARAYTDRYANMELLQQIMTYEVYPAIREQVVKRGGASITFIVGTWRWTIQGGDQDGVSLLPDIMQVLTNDGYTVKVNNVTRRGEPCEELEVTW